MSVDIVAGKAFDKLNEAYERDMRISDVYDNLSVRGWKLEPYVRESKKTRRNDLCPCGSKEKYKKCCIKKGA